MTTWTSGLCHLAGSTIHYLRTGGSGPPVVLLHGLMGSGACWTPVARVLEAEYDVVMPDARGHGGSSAPPHGYRYEDHASDLMGLIRTLELSRPVLIGHSMGGMTAALAASQGGAGSLRGLVLVDPTFLTPARQREVHESDVAREHARVLGLDESELISQARARQPNRSSELIEIQAKARLSTSVAAFEVLTPPNPDYRELIAMVEVPTLLVIGDNPVVTLGMARELGELNPRLQVEQVLHAGHGLPFDQPERLSEVTLTFLRETIARAQVPMD
jgi:N-formylmaleamate deformylase